MVWDNGLLSELSFTWSFTWGESSIASPDSLLLELYKECNRIFLLMLSLMRCMTLEEKAWPSRIWNGYLPKKECLPLEIITDDDTAIKGDLVLYLETGVRWYPFLGKVVAWVAYLDIAFGQHTMHAWLFVILSRICIIIRIKPTLLLIGRNRVTTHPSDFLEIWSILAETQRTFSSYWIRWLFGFPILSTSYGAFISFELFMMSNFWFLHMFAFFVLAHSHCH